MARLIEGRGLIADGGVVTGLALLDEAIAPCSPMR